MRETSGPKPSKKLCKAPRKTPQSEAAGFFSGKPGALHMLGIGGVGMAGLAVLLKARGWDVSGCDVKPGRMAGRLAEQGIRTRHGHAAAHITRDLRGVVCSAAVPDSCPELARARRMGLPVFRRGEVLAAFASRGHSIAVAGSHGKTTTASLIAYILRQAGCAPSFAVGGEARQLGSVAAIGNGDWLVVEADESDGTLALYAPEIAVITNIDFDHAEHYKNIDAVAACFQSLAEQTRGLLIFGANDRLATEVSGAAARAMGAGTSSAAAWRAACLRRAGAGYSFNVLRRGRRLGKVTLRLPGLHNVRNALAAAAAASSAGVRWPVIAEALASFEGVSRRFERLATRHGIAVYSDYAHHPAEILALGAVARRLSAKRRVAVFQPHRYTRTRALGADFPAALDAFDPLLLLPVHAASETPQPGGSIGHLYARFRARRASPPLLASSAAKAAEFLRRSLKHGDALFAIGAGDAVDAVAREVARALEGLNANILDPADAWANAMREIGLSQAAVCRPHEPLAGKTTFGLGGKADVFAVCAAEPDIVALRHWTLENNVPLVLLGGGSNVLVGDLGVRGVVARLAGACFTSITRETAGVVSAGAGAPLSRLLGWTARNGLSGLEFLAGIPGTVGGALRMNAGAFGSDLGERTVWVRFLDKTGALRTESGGNLGFSYRACRGLDGCVALAAGFAVDKERAAIAQARIKDNLKRRAWMAGMRCAGSVFRNPAGKTPAGALLDCLGFKGRRVGGAKVSEQHANVIEAESGATASDVEALVDQIRVETYSRAGVALQEEVVRLE